MSTYGQYQDARDAAWRALLELPEKKLPVDVEALAKKLGVEIHPFPGKEQERLYALVNRAAGGRPCVSLRIRRNWHIFLRPKTLDEIHQRFAIAHELGHLLLAHETETPAPGVRCFSARENIGDVLDDPQELEDYTADLFAVRLLAPACLLHELHIDSSGGIINLCGLPPRAAAIRAERMQLLDERDVYYTHILETKVRNAFMSWLNSARFPEAASVQLRYASASVSMPEIHSYPKDAPEPEMPPSDPSRIVEAAPRFIPEKPLTLPKTDAHGKAKTMLRFFLRRNRRKILLGAAVLAFAVILYFIGK